MFAILNRLGGRACLEIRGNMPERFLNNCAARGLQIISVSRIDIFTIKLILPTSMLREAEAIAVKSNCEAKVLGSGRRWLKRVRRRLFPVVCILFLVGVIFWSKFYVWEIELNGNRTIPDGRILSVLADCGVKSGAFWPSFSADNIRSEVLYKIPELSWITVNMRGSLAEIITVERNEPPEMLYKGECSNIVADKDAFVISVNTLVGQTMVKPGYAVKKGDILISGAVESSFSPPRFLHSLGSVQGETNKEIIALKPENELIRHYTGEKSRKIALIIGNKRINFYSGSSNSVDLCDKISYVWNLKVKDLLSLPISIVCETQNYYEICPLKADDFDSGQMLEQCLRECFSREIGDGELISEKLSFSKARGLLIGSLRVRCREEIGVSSPVSEAQKIEIEMNFTQKADDQ